MVTMYDKPFNNIVGEWLFENVLRLSHMYFSQTCTVPVMKSSFSPTTTPSFRKDDTYFLR